MRIDAKNRKNDSGSDKQKMVSETAKKIIMGVVSIVVILAIFGALTPIVTTNISGLNLTDAASGTDLAGFKTVLLVLWFLLVAAVPVGIVVAMFKMGFKG